jgi:IS5 family transposase
LKDEKVVEQIRENPYLQYFIGYGEYRDEEPFESSMMVHFRKRLGLEELSEINKLIHSKHWKHKQKKRVQDRDNDKKYKGGGSGGGSLNRRKLIVDTSCAQADIRYPTDLSLLNEAREKSERIIDVLHEPLRGDKKKARRYWERARRDYLRAAKKRRLKATELRKAIGKQLRYVRRDLQHIETLGEKRGLELLSRRQYRDLLVIGEVYRQQE